MPIVSVFFIAHDVGGLEVNPTESDSEDEWNYIKGDEKKPEKLLVNYENFPQKFV